MKTKQGFIHRVVMAVLIFMLTFGTFPVDVLSETSGEDQEVTESQISTESSLGENLLDNLTEPITSGDPEGTASQESGSHGDSSETADFQQEEAAEEQDQKAVNEQKTQESVKEAKTTVAESPASDLLKSTSRDLHKTDGIEVKVNDWSILNGSLIPLSESVAADSNVAYTFEFSWTLSLAQGMSLKEGDYFAYDFVQIDNLQGDGWGQTTVGTSDLVVKNVKIGSWFTENGKIKVVFNKKIETFEISNLNGVSFKLPTNSTTNRYQAGGIFDTTFGGITKKIAYSQYKMRAMNGVTFKRMRSSSNLAANWEMTANLTAILELNGDKVDWSKNIHKGFSYDPTNQTYQWGEHSTGIRDVNNKSGALLYFEDELDPGVTIRNMTIQPDIRVPMNLPANALETLKGGEPSDVHAYDQQILNHSGTQGPQYRKGDSDGTNYPSEEDSLKLISQAEGETKVEFRKKIRATPGTYGIYVEGKGKSAVRTVMVNMGSVDGSGAKHDGKTYEELLDTKRSGNDRTITDRTGKTVAIAEFAKRAADRTIRNGYYPDSAKNRELLENYYTLVYGESNVVEGRIPTYTIWLDTDYPPEASSGTKSNTIDHYYRNAHRLNNAEIPESRTASGTLTNPFAALSVNSTEAVLFKWDEDDNSVVMNGFEFKLQMKNGTGWEDVAGKDKLKTETITINNVSYNGAIKVTGLTPGKTYRFVETKSLNAYDPTLSSDYNRAAGAVISKDFEISLEEAGPVVNVRNKKAKVAKYRVEHWLLEKGKDIGSVDNFYLADNDEFEGKVDSIVKSSSHEKGYPNYQYDGTLPYNVKDQLVKEDGTTVLKLYYVDASDKPTYTYRVEHYLQKRGSSNTNNIKETNYLLKKTELKSGYAGSTANAVPLDFPGYKHADQSFTIKSGLVKTDGSLVLKLYYIYEQSSKTQAVFYKIDEHKNPMPSVDSEGKQLKNDKNEDLKVTFKLVKWNWSKKAPTGLTNAQYIDATPPTPANIGAVGASGKEWNVVAEELVTDKDGKIDVSHLLDKNSTTLNYSGNYALIETSTYPDHQLKSPAGTTTPQEGQVYYYFTGGTTAGVGWTNTWRFTNGAWGKKATNNECVNNDFNGEVAIINYAQSGELDLFKANEENQLMKPNGENTVKFNLYAWNGSGKPGVNDRPDSSSPNWSQVGDEYKVGSDGRILGLTKKDIPKMADYYGLVETETHSGYDKPDNYWLITTKASGELALGYQKVIDTVQYMSKSGDDPDPGLLKPGDVDNPTYKKGVTEGYYTIKNQKMPPTIMDFYFIKEDPDKERLEGVEFKLYKKLHIPSRSPDSYPNTPDADYWDLDNPVGIQTSDHHGNVIFEDLEKGEYLLRETKTVDGYQLPSGYWVVKLFPEEQGYSNQLEILGCGDPLPPAFRETSNNFYLTNFRAFVMPTAGGRYVIFLTVFGIMTVGGGVWLFLDPRKRHHS